jgi:hypothetical protein
MRCAAALLIGLSVAALAGASLPSAADAQVRARAAARAAATRPLDLTTKGPSVAMQAAQAAQTAAAQPGSAAPVEAPTTAPADTLSGVTVRPDVPVQGRVVASTDATSLTSPNFSDADAQPAPLAVGVGQNTAIGRQTVDNTPPAGGILHNNPELLGSQPTRGEVGVTSVF